ncbi:MAG: protein translocase subunit SecF [Tissierellales bacterium]|jgi:preprotein translocase SecF subunit|nr:protein translocase subunit SecF [Tissierellales bacterium]
MNIIKSRKIFFAISLAIILIGLVTMGVKGLNQGIDFTGGTLVQIDFGKEVPVNELRMITDELDAKTDIIHAGDGNHEVIIKTTKDLDNKERLAFFEKFAAKYDLNEADNLIQSQKFKPSIGDEIRQSAYISIFIATLCMLLYITVRFEFKFGVAAVVALVHDVLVALAVYAVLQIPITSSFVAAILTIVGYSINDTIVVFDRIRENRKYFKRNAQEELVNKSIAQTIVRSINTSATTLITILCLYIFGVEAIQDFALPLIVGVAVGTYSSIFIASPVWYMLTKKFKSKSARA